MTARPMDTKTGSSVLIANLVAGNDTLKATTPTTPHASPGPSRVELDGEVIGVVDADLDAVDASVFSGSSTTDIH